MSDINDRLLNFLNEWRSEGRPLDPPLIIQGAINEDIPIDMDQVVYLLHEMRHEIPIVPKFIQEFIYSYLEESPPRSILDAWTVVGELLSFLVGHYHPDVALGMSLDSTPIEIGRYLQTTSHIEWLIGDPMERIDGINRDFDLILGFPPWVLKKQTIELSIENTSLEIEGTLGNLLMLKAARLLTNRGVGIFLVEPSVMYERNAKSVRKNFSNFGIYIDAVLSIPSGSFAPATQAEGLLLILKREKPSDLFVGQLTPEKDTTEFLLKNLEGRKQGQEPPLGVLTELNSFNSYQDLLLQDEISKLARQYGFEEPVPLEKLAMQINLFKRSGELGFPDKQNCVYLPLIGNSPAVTSVKNLQIKPQNYAQIVLDEKKALPIYLAKFFNNPLGRKIRQSLSVGVIPKITMARLLTADIYLPDLETQADVIRVQAMISELSAQLSSLEKELWDKPRRAKDIEKALKSWNRETGFETWIESLPFPIASILWAYSAESRTGERTELLFHFFHGLAEFHATILLSAFVRDPCFFGEEVFPFIKSDPSYYQKLQKSGFGDWHSIGSCLAKAARTFIGGKVKKDRCIELLGKPSDDYLRMLTGKKLNSIIADASQYRNDWPGHGGHYSDKEKETHLIILQELLSDIQEVISDSYLTVDFVIPGHNLPGKGVFDTDVKLLKGTKSIFKNVTLRTSVYMEPSDLYYLHKNQLRPIVLLPFIRMKEGPESEKNACYYYNRNEPAGIRWVSYHAASEGHRVEPDEDVVAALSLLDPRNYSTPP